MNIMLRRNRIVIATSLLLTAQLATAAESSSDQGLTGFFSNFFSPRTTASDAQPADKANAKKETFTNILGFEIEKPGWYAIESQPYSKIVIDGQTHVIINPASKNKISVWNHNAEVLFSDDTLVIHTPYQPDDAEHYNNIVLRDINDVKMIRVRDDASIINSKSKRKNKTKTGPFTLIIEDHGRVALEGMFDIKRLVHSSDEKSSLLWVDSPAIEVIANNGSVKLAGVAKSAKIWGYGHAKIHADHLRSDNTWVTATDHSFIESNPIGYFYAHAAKHSTIWHRGQYKTVTRITEDHGNVLYTNS